MPVTDVLALIGYAAQLLTSSAIFSLLVWIVKGGWKFIGRVFGFNIDLLLVSFIGRIYDYFLQLLEGTLFNETVISELLQNIYVFIGVIMFFRLMMIVVKYLVNPDLVSDAKIGVNALIQRVIIGLCGILFIPTLVTFAIRFQGAVLTDNIIQQIIIPSDMLDAVKEKVDKGGQYIATYVLSGFVSPSETASSQAKTAYRLGLESGDLSTIDSLLNEDGFMGSSYNFDYFFFISTFCLCYVLYVMIKYCLDIITRYFRMLIYQILAPIAMIEYMINGSDNGVFKSWRSGILSTYFMLFVRVLAMWFVVFVMCLMQTSSDSPYVEESLLVSDDYLLRALIIMALIGFMMDLPKLVGQVFGLDLEQESSAGGMLKQVGGMLKGAAIGGLAIGGAAVGGAIGVGKAAIGATNFGKNLSASKSKMAAKHPGLNSISSASSAATSGILGAALSSNSFTGSAYKGYQGQKDAQDKASKEASAASKKIADDKKEEIRDEYYANARATQKVDKRDDAGNPTEAHVMTELTPAGRAGVAGAMSAANAAGVNPQIFNTNGTGEATIDLSDVKINVAGNATANYTGGLETNITGKAVTNYNGDVETSINGKATGTFNGDLETNVSGRAVADINDIETNVRGKAVADIDNIETNVSGKAVANIDNVETNVRGKAVANIDNIETNVSGKAVANIDNIETNVSGKAVADVNDIETNVKGTAKTEINDVDVTISNGNVEMSDMKIDDVSRKENNKQ